MFNHVLDLLLHRHREEHDPVEQQHRPEDRQVKHREKGHGESNQNRLHRRAPERLKTVLCRMEGLGGVKSAGS